MFEKREYSTFGGSKANHLYRPICDYWAKQGYSVAQLSPYRIQGESYDSKIGLKRRFAVNMYEHGGNTYLDTEVRAKATDLGLFGGILAAVVCWPIALIGGAVSYSKYETEASEDLGRFWGYIDYVAHAQNGGA